MKSLSASTFDKAVRDAETLVVKFFADWCPDCRRIEQAFAGFADQSSDLAFAEVNVEESPELASRFAVRGIPTFLVFRNQQLADRLHSRDAKTVQQVADFVARQRARGPVSDGPGRTASVK